MCAFTTEHVWIRGQLMGVNSTPTTWVPRIELGSSGWQWVPLPSESSQWPLVLIHILSRPHPALADISRVYTACTGTLPRNTGGLQDEACDWRASQLSAGSDYLLRIIRRRFLSQWSGPRACGVGGGWLYYWGLQSFISESSPGAAVLVRKAEGSTARHHSISSLRIHPLRIFKFYFQIHSDLYPKVGVVLKVLATGNNQVLSWEFPEHSPNVL